ncbi:hypothetical protein C2845_PM14G18310 [Panicum miliaceum]|uniref:Uncharacterized protein n=1 Tax=Panicum miliaceum TaxID=4540 RepID=A0A3L6PU72_PANMI|nr:hypothetical protein C2845_PM14G18310 [Panicum miliaceum]
MYADPAPGVPLRRALLYVVLLLGSNLATFLFAGVPRVRGAARAAVRAHPELGHGGAARSRRRATRAWRSWACSRPSCRTPSTAPAPTTSSPRSGSDPRPRLRAPAAPPDQPPLPAALWSTPPDRSVHWSAYACKPFRCLVDRARSPRFDDCRTASTSPAGGAAAGTPPAPPPART